MTVKENAILPFLTSLLVCFGCYTASTELAVIETSFGNIVIKFYGDVAPKHVESFKILAKRGYFDGTTFHRVVPGFVIQGGDPNSKDLDRLNDGNGGHAGKFYGIGKEDDPNTWMLPAEFSRRPHKRGTVSMARAQDPNSGGSQFFICVEPQPRLDGQYTVFGEVVQGMGVVDSIVNTKTPRTLNPQYGGRDGDNPLEPTRMKVWLATGKELGIEQGSGK